ncbi:Zinc finger, C2H2-type [Penicillium camemberti]|uniref:Zinc finger, C2H2-type n=1 Tax=Penicillium camemberti (strain FM 013) TaxID=1429867 RepID=A0A0G4PKF4_PENC3|nr:Zinc finger, C2H2-type [Penicillium camemberti]
MFHDPGCVTRHFDAIHLEEEPLKCNWCEVGLLHRMALQRHASDVHRVRSRWPCSNPMQGLQKQE